MKKSIFSVEKTPPRYYFNLDIIGPMFQNNPDGDVGIELEIEGSRLPRSVSGIPGCEWEVKEDGSLRNGLEYVTSGPIDHSIVPAGVTHLYDTLSSSKLNLSTRCSTHVHINLKSMNFGQICSFVILWSCFERVLTEWCGPTRVNNHFCVSLVDSKRMVADWTAFFTEGLVPFQTDRRYASLNPMSMDRFGSLEIRTMEGCSSPVRVIKWVNILMAIKNFAMTRYSNPEILVSDFSAVGPRGLLDQILVNLPEESAEVFGLAETLGLDINAHAYETLRLLQPIVYIFPWTKAQDLFIRDTKTGEIKNPFKVASRREGRLPVKRRYPLPFDKDAPVEPPQEQEFKDVVIEEEIPRFVRTTSRLSDLVNPGAGSPPLWLNQMRAAREAGIAAQVREAFSQPINVPRGWTSGTISSNSIPINEPFPTLTQPQSALVESVEREMERVREEVRRAGLRREITDFGDAFDDL